MKEYNYTAHLQNGNEIKLVTRSFSMKLNEEQLGYLDRDLNRTYPDYRLIKYHLEVKEIH